MNTKELYRILRTSHVQAQGIVDTIAEPLLVLDGSLCVQGASRSFFETFKVDRFETIGKHIYELGNGQWDIPDLRLLLTEVIPRSTAVIDYKVEHDFPGLGRRTMLLTARTLFHPDNAFRSLLLTIMDATERSHPDAARQMQLDEIVHRMRNLLGVVQSIARQTATQGRSAEEFRNTFLGRFTALVEAQDLAFTAHKDMSLKALVERVLAPYAANAEAVVMEAGPALELRASASLSLSLVLHELATNAVKHGSLSAAGGRMRISWQVDDATGELRLRWVESGGPPVIPPTATGYGTQLIQSATTYSLGGQVKQQYAAGGLEVEILLPHRNELSLG